MSVSDSYCDYALDQLRQVTPVRARRMFGELGVYSGDAFFAIIADDKLYLKADGASRADYEALGMQPFAPMGTPMRYYELPEEVIEDVDQLRGWVEKALRAARNTASARPRTQRPPKHTP
jgi:DNA transformation protein